MTSTKHFTQHIKLNINIYANILLIILLLLTTTYHAIKTSSNIINNPDATISAQLIGDGLVNSHIALQNEHTNILKMPILAFQDKFAYSYQGFVILNVIIAGISLLAWVLVVALFFGKKYLTGTLLLLNCFVAGSTLFHLSFSWVTIRNIEFPLLLLLCFILSKALTMDTYSKKMRIAFISSLILYALIIASDHYYLYVVTLPLCGVLFWHYIRQQKGIFNQKPLFIVILTTVIGLGIPKLLVAFHIINLQSSPYIEREIVTINELWPSISATMDQFLTLHSANIFGAVIAKSNLFLFVNLALVGTALVACLSIIKRNLSKNQNSLSGSGFGMLLLCTVYLSVPLVYILSGQAITIGLHGEFVTSSAARFLTLSVLITPVLIVHYLFSLNISSPGKEIKLLIFLFAFCAIILGLSSSRDIYDSQRNVDNAQQTVFINLAEQLREEETTIIVSDFYYGATTRFWAEDRIISALVKDCNLVYTPLSRPSWYKVNSKSHRSALIVDHNSPDAHYWDTCSNDRLIKIYGTPYMVTPVNDGVEAWFYEKDIRQYINN